MVHTTLKLADNKAKLRHVSEVPEDGRAWGEPSRAQWEDGEGGGGPRLQAGASGPVVRLPVQGL